MARDLKVFKCPVCGNIVTLLHEGGGELVCCGKPMKLLKAGEIDTAAKEKHVPVVTVTDSSVSVKVGDIAHPMTAEHLIEWIALVTDSEVFIKHLTPADEPKAEFLIAAAEGTFDVYEYCNLHGLWKA